VDVVTPLLIAGIQQQRTKLQKARLRFAKGAARALKRGDYVKAISDGAKALVAHQTDQILARQQNYLRKASTR